MDKECSIVRDLLPLYAEDLVGAETAEFVAAHIAACPDCEKEYEAMKSGAPVPAEPRAEAAPLKSIKKVIIKKRVRAVILAVALAGLRRGHGVAANAVRLPGKRLVRAVGLGEHGDLIGHH